MQAETYERAELIPAIKSETAKQINQAESTIFVWHCVSCVKFYAVISKRSNAYK
jgi:hypothetical protein